MILVPGLGAQSFDTSPDGLLTQEGPGVANLFGTTPFGRFMYFDGGLRSKPGPIREVAVRGNDQSYALSTNGLGRSWQGVTLELSECDMANLSGTFAANPKTTPTRVFLGSVAFPSRNGPPLVRPDPFGSVTGHMKYPFRTNWVYSGTRAICLDFRYSGGQLANSQVWLSSQLLPYSLDGYVRVGTSARGIEWFHGGFLTNGGCSDASFGFGAYADLRATTYSASAPRSPGQVVFEVKTVFTAPDAPVLHAFNTIGDANGVPFPGVTCNRLYVKLDASTVILPRAAGARSRYAQVDYELPMRFSSGLKGMPVWFQAAFADSSTGALRLTNASQNTIQDMPPTIARKVVYSFSSSAPTGVGPTDDPDWNPVFRYAR